MQIRITIIVIKSIIEQNHTCISHRRNKQDKGEGGSHDDSAVLQQLSVDANVSVMFNFISSDSDDEQFVILV